LFIDERPIALSKLRPKLRHDLGQPFERSTQAARVERPAGIEKSRARRQGVGDADELFGSGALGELERCAM